MAAIDNFNHLPAKDLFRPDEVADYFSVHRRTILRWCKRGLLDSVGIAQTLRITRASILALMAQAARTD